MPKKAVMRETGFPSRNFASGCVLLDVNYADDHRSMTGPLKATRRIIDRAAVLTQMAQSGRSGVTLRDGVGRDES